MAKKKNKKKNKNKHNYNGYPIQVEFIVCEEIPEGTENRLEEYFEKYFSKQKYHTLYTLTIALYTDSYAISLKDSPDNELYGNKSLFENNSFQNLQYNIYSILSIVDEDIKDIVDFLEVATPLNYNDGKGRSENYGYDKSRATKELKKMYEKIGQYMTEYEFDNYSYESCPTIYLNFIGNKVRLFIDKKYSSYIYFKEGDITDMACRHLMEQLDECFA